MGEIILFPSKQPSKFGFERARRRRKENPDQLNLFPGQVQQLPSNLAPFEEALLLDERGDMHAGEAYWHAISEGDHVADAYCNLGIIESGAGRSSKAFDCFTKALEHDPRHFEAHYNLGNLYFEADNLRLAKMHYELAVGVEHGSPNIFFNLGLVLAILEEREAAIDALVKYQVEAPQEELRKVANLISELRESLATSGKKNHQS